MAPTFFSMSYEFDEFIDYCNISLPFEFVELDPLYTVNFRNNPDQYTIYKDLSRLAGQFKKIEPDFKSNMRKFLKATAKIFHDTEYKIVKKNHTTFAGFLFQLLKVPPQHAPKMIRSVWNELGRYFKSYEVKVIFSLVSFFLGATPFDTPAVYTLLTYTELQHDGYYNVAGGMYKIVEGLLEELKKAGVSIYYNTEITDFEDKNGQIRAFWDATGKKWDADSYIVNADAAWFRGKILGRKKYSGVRLDKMKWTLAPFTMYLGVKGKIDTLEHHNYFLGDNFKEYASKIFKNSISLDKPYYYVNVPSKFNKNAAPQGCEAIFILCPVPDLRYKSEWSDREKIAQFIIDDLSERINFDINANLMTKTIYDPEHWQKMFNLYKGSGLGLAHDINQIGYFRPKNRDEKYKNLYYVGASTVPGTGLPMAIISSRLVTERINNDNKLISKK
jgi:phytoene desaturase